MDGLNDDRMSERERRADKILMLRIDISTRILCAMIAANNEARARDGRTLDFMAVESVGVADLLIDQCRYGEDGPPEEEDDLDEPDDDEEDEEDDDDNSL